MEERVRVAPYNMAGDWQSPQPTAGSSMFSATTTTTISQRRRSSAAHTRPAGPPPNLPIPSLPDITNDRPGHSSTIVRPSTGSDDSQRHTNGVNRGTRSASFARQGPSPSLAAVAAFPHHSVFTAQSSASLSVDDLSDSPPPSILPPSSSRLQAPPLPPDVDTDRLLPPMETRSEHRPPSSRRALTRALELAREAVQLDSNSNNPQGAVMAYGRSVALLSEVMDRVRRGEDTTEPRRRNGRRRSSVAQEEEVRRLQKIHDTYADRMNILSVVYSIPPLPYTTASIYSPISADSTQPNSPTSSVSPVSETSDQIPQVDYTMNDTHVEDNNPQVAPGISLSDHVSAHEGIEAIGAAMFMDLASPVRSTISGLPVSSSHPYANTQYDPPTPHGVAPSLPAQSTTPNRMSMQPRRSRASSSALPPALPPPLNSPPLAPTTANETPLDMPLHGSRQFLDPAIRQWGDSVGHRRTSSGSKLAALEEETEKFEHSAIEISGAEVRTNSRLIFVDTRTVKNESPPLPALPSPASGSPGTPRNNSSPQIPSSVVIPRQRGSSQAPRPEVVVINPTIHQSTISQRRLKTSVPPTPRSSSPSESVVSGGSHPRSVASSLPSSGASLSGVGRTRSSSQPGRRPSLIGGRISPPEQRPPLPSTTVTNININGAASALRKTSFPSKLNPNAQIQLTVQTDLPSMSINPPLMPPPAVISSVLPITPISPLPAAAPADPLRKPYHLMNLLRTTMTSTTGGYITRRLHVPQEVWSQGGAKLSNLPEKVRVVGILCSALEDLQNSSSEHFGAGNVSSGMGLGIGSIGRKEGEAWISKLEDFSTMCDGVVANFGKKLGVGEGFVLKKTTWGDKLGRRFDKYINGKNLDSPAAYVQGLRKLFLHAQLLDEHTKAISCQPVAPAYAAFPADIRTAADIKLRRSSEFFASVVLTFVIRDLSQLLDKYAKKCEKWLAE
ncbi:uncharacterized protein BT62DRAFT_503808 [Guyanagaster necrorhizus]|uniref:MIT domain-containing protein n=1 Tax=Guyanagaster necrorhizus TaxID=856835 RepID=A0A9P7W0G1_9AGAR|nr:uncharacterized protein BT62DRAFT_503808 [Guyanagaster necrorhizus MCA 3950]KAG7450309.1 hypothetical protein BT62DRAFT_503808 [Guyanagaster necrorhizus MCA 3950]